jgi:hypothetical protein
VLSSFTQTHAPGPYAAWVTIPLSRKKKKKGTVFPRNHQWRIISLWSSTLCPVAVDSRATAGENIKRLQFVVAFEAETGEATAAAIWRRRWRQRQEEVAAIWLRWTQGSSMATAILFEWCPHRAQQQENRRSSSGPALLEHRDPSEGIRERLLGR